MEVSLKVEVAVFLWVVLGDWVPRVLQMKN